MSKVLIIDAKRKRIGTTLYVIFLVIETITMFFRPWGLWYISPLCCIPALVAFIWGIKPVKAIKIKPKK